MLPFLIKFGLFGFPPFFMFYVKIFVHTPIIVLNFIHILRVRLILIIFRFTKINQLPCSLTGVILEVHKISPMLIIVSKSINMQKVQCMIHFHFLASKIHFRVLGGIRIGHLRVVLQIKLTFFKHNVQAIIALSEASIIINGKVVGSIV